MGSQDNVTADLSYERSAGFPALRVAGVDEVGRGCLAGPVVACAVILPEAWDVRYSALKKLHPWIERVRDSKMLDPEERDELFPLIQAAVAGFAIGQASPAEIDEINILQATFLAMRRALAGLAQPAQKVLVDGNWAIPQVTVPCQPIIKGDQHSLSIACASILAKVTRDRLMVAMDLELPGYGFGSHKGYPTPEHLEGLDKLGVSAHHRRSFAPVRERLPEAERLALEAARAAPDEAQPELFGEVQVPAFDSSDV